MTLHSVYIVLYCRNPAFWLQNFNKRLFHNETDAKNKGKLHIASLTWVRLVTGSALQSRKWQLIGMS